MLFPKVLGKSLLKDNIMRGILFLGAEVYFLNKQFRIPLKF